MVLKVQPQTFSSNKRFILADWYLTRVSNYSRSIRKAVSKTIYLWRPVLPGCGTTNRRLTLPGSCLPRRWAAGWFLFGFFFILFFFFLTVLFASEWTKDPRESTNKQIRKHMQVISWLVTRNECSHHVNDFPLFSIEHMRVLNMGAALVAILSSSSMQLNIRQPFVLSLSLASGAKHVNSPWCCSFRHTDIAAVHTIHAIHMQ